MSDLTFEVEGKIYTLPEFINIETYVKIFKIKDILSEDYFQAKLVHLVTGCPIEQLLEADYVYVGFLSNYVMGLVPRTNADFVDRFEIDGVHYGFLPNWKKGLSFAEYVDIDTLASKPYEELLDYLHVLAAMYYRPITNERSFHDFDIEKYTVDGLDERSLLFKKKLDAGVILGAQFFFTKSARISSTTTHPSLTMSLWSQMKMVWKNRKIIREMGPLLLKKDLDGTQLSTDYQMTILRNTISSLKKPWWKLSIKWSTLLPKIKRLKRDKKK